MGKRKQLSKSLRFEVFKRDKFTCVYCGKKAPDAVLEVDHIKPVSKGGTNDIMNLVTACCDCNRGKSDKELSDDSVIKKQERQLKELADRQEQLEMLIEWRTQLLTFDDEKLTKVADYFEICTGFSLNDNGMRVLKKWLRKYSVEEICDAIDIADETYEKGEDKFNKISSICENRRQDTVDKSRYYINYTNKALINNGFYVDKKQLYYLIPPRIKTDEDFEHLKVCIKTARSWTDFKNTVYEEFD